MIATSGPLNTEIARVFREVADQLELTRANQFRIRAYRNAARTVEELITAADGTRMVPSPSM